MQSINQEKQIQTNHFFEEKQASSQVEKGLMTKVVEIALDILTSFTFKASALLSLIGSSVVICFISTNAMLVGLGMAVGLVALTVLISLSRRKKTNSIPVANPLSEAERATLIKQGLKQLKEGRENLASSYSIIQRLKVMIQDESKKIEQLRKTPPEDLRELLIKFNDYLFFHTACIQTHEKCDMKGILFNELLFCTSPTFSINKLASDYLIRELDEQINSINLGIKKLEAQFKTLNQSVADDVLLQIKANTYILSLVGDLTKLFETAPLVRTRT